jgi:hypothetical protein
LDGDADMVYDLFKTSSEETGDDDVETGSEQQKADIPANLRGNRA